MKYNLNEEQKLAVISSDKKILCLAGAGTGKTTTMLMRISHLVEQGVNPESILVLTFTNAAAFEMKDRYKRDHLDMVSPNFRTFHSFCYYLLSNDSDIRHHLGYMSTPSIIDEDEFKSLCREAQSATGIKKSLQSLQKSQKNPEDKYSYTILQKYVTKMLKKKNLITFDALCSNVCELFTNDSPLIQKYKNKYQYVFVDEFQDTDIIQYNFIKSFGNSYLFVVGDALQAIYGFRGADSSIIKQLSNDSSWTTIKLKWNYRSSPNICEFANQHSIHADSNYRVVIESGLPESPDIVDLQQVSSDISFNDCISYCIQDISSRKGDSAILCRTNREVESIKHLLDAYNVKYDSNKKSTDILYALKSAIDNDTLLNWLSGSLSNEQYSIYLRLSSLEDSYSLINFLEDFIHVPSIAVKWNLVHSIRTICKQSNLSIIERCNQLLEFLHCSELQLDELQCTSMKSAINHIIDLYDEIEDLDCSIYVGTIHSVKGLEYDNVYVLGVNNHVFSLNNEENKNLYYVAITRAKQHLVVFERSLN